MTIFAYDFDGTTSDSGASCLEVNNMVLSNNGFSSVTWNRYREVSTMNGWKEFYGAFGVPPELAEKMGEEYNSLRGSVYHPGLDAFAMSHLLAMSAKYGDSKVLMLTNESVPNVMVRTYADYFDLTDRVISTKGEKSTSLAQLHQDTGEDIVYVGDTVGDGQACINARVLGVPVTFVAAATPIAFNTTARLEDHVKNHAGARLVRNLNELFHFF